MKTNSGSIQSRVGSCLSRDHFSEIEWKSATGVRTLLHQDRSPASFILFFRKTLVLSQELIYYWHITDIYELTVEKTGLSGLEEWPV